MHRLPEGLGAFFAKHVKKQNKPKKTTEKNKQKETNKKPNEQEAVLLDLLFPKKKFTIYYQTTSEVTKKKT